MNEAKIHTKLVVVGGFLGAGKTSSIAQMAKLLLQAGKKVGVVTNDQGSQLVDTAFLKSMGLDVLEVTGGCFCCNFDEFTRKLQTMSENAPDLILAEPVGSCTDLVAAIIKPLHSSVHKRLHFKLLPLSVVLDPKRLSRLIREKKRLASADGKDAGVLNEINYLFSKQIEEADILVLNKIDTLTEAEKKQMLSFLETSYPGKEILAVSAREPSSLTPWLGRLMDLDPKDPGQSLDIDYQRYAKAEADLGWLNTSATLQTGALSSGPLQTEAENQDIDGNQFLLALAEALRDQMQDSPDLAHMKLYLSSEHEFCKLSCVSLQDGFSLDSSKKMSLPLRKDSSLIINIRAVSNPQRLAEITENTLKAVAESYGLTLSALSTEAFSPKEPKPTYRM